MSSLGIEPTNFCAANASTTEPQEHFPEYKFYFNDRL